MATSGTDILQVDGTHTGLSGGGATELVFCADSGGWLNGGKGKEFLAGFGFAGHLFGGKGNGVISGVEDTDTDIFVFRSKSGMDVITEFDLNNDVLQISKTKTIKNIRDVIEHAKQHGDDLVVTLGKGQTITLKNVTKAEFKLNAGDHIEIV